MIFTPLQKLPNNVSNLGVAAGFEWLPKKLPNLITLVKELLRWKEEIRKSFKID